MESYRPGTDLCAVYGLMVGIIIVAIIHFTHERIQTETDEEPCLTSHIPWVVELGSEPRLSESWVHLTPFPMNDEYFSSL